MKITKGGREYTLADVLNGKEGWERHLAVLDAWPDNRNDYDAVVGMLSKLVTAWEWEGSPSDADAWAIVPSNQLFAVYAEAVSYMQGESGN